MTDTTSQASGALSGNVLFYTQPEPISFEAHGKLGVTPADKPYAFVAQTHIVPLTVTEFAPAAARRPAQSERWSWLWTYLRPGAC